MEGIDAGAKISRMVCREVFYSLIVTPHEHCQGIALVTIFQPSAVQLQQYTKYIQSMPGPPQIHGCVKFSLHGFTGWLLSKLS